MKQKSHMPELIQRYCHETGQDVPKSQSDILYVIIHSIVHNYVQRYMDLCELTDQTYDTAVIVGGGAKNHLLIQLLQDMLPIPVMVIQEEATTLGNLFLQLEALT